MMTQARHKARTLIMIMHSALMPHTGPLFCVPSTEIHHHYNPIVYFTYLLIWPIIFLSYALNQQEAPSFGAKNHNLKLVSRMDINVMNFILGLQKQTKRRYRPTNATKI